MAGHRNPDTIRNQVEELLFSYPPLRESHCPVSVSVRDGLVELNGIVRTSIMRDMAEVLAWSVPGVKEVVNNLLVDVEIEKAVAQRLAADERTRPWCTSLRVRVIRGKALLFGDVPEEAREAVLQVVKEIPGVLGVEFATQPMPL